MIEKRFRAWIGGAKGVTEAVRVSQYDDVWKLVATICDGDRIMPIPDGWSALFTARKADGTIATASAVPEDGNVAVTLSQATTAAIGRAVCEIRLSDGQAVVGTANFPLIVDESPASRYRMPQDDFGALESLINRALPLSVVDARLAKQDAEINGIRASVSNPFVVAASRANMTDPSKAYVYIGDGTGADAGLIPGAAYSPQDGDLVMVSMATDPALELAGVPADAKAVGDAIVSSQVAVDEWGSVYESQNALYLHHKSIENVPEYDFRLGDFFPGRYRNSEGFPWAGDGWCTKNHPIEIVDSMVVNIPDGCSEEESIFVILGNLDGGEFEPVYGFRHKQTEGAAYNLIRFRRYACEYLVVETNGSAETLRGVRIVRSNPMADLECLTKLPLINTSFGKYVPNLDFSTGRFDEFYTTRTALKTKDYTADGVTTRFSVQDDQDVRNGRFFCRKVVRINGSATSSYTISDADGETGDLIFAVAPVAGAKIKYKYLVLTNSGRRSIKPWHTWIYANGMPIDAIFYDRAGNEIEWFAGRTSVNGCLSRDRDIVYPTQIRIPETAVECDFAVYGPRSASAFVDLGMYLLEIKDTSGLFGKVNRGEIRSETAGQIIGNALQLQNLRYPTQGVSTRDHVLAYGPSSGSEQIAQGIGYAPTAGRDMVFTHMSLYTCLTALRNQHGYSSQSKYSLLRNMPFGMMCAGFVSAACGMGHYQGAEYWLQTYAGQLKRVVAGDELQIGDIFVKTKYVTPVGEKKKFLSTHVAIVADVAYDRKSGRFCGYKIVDTANIWTRVLYSSLKDMIPGTGADNNIDPYDEAGQYRAGDYAEFDNRAWVCIAPNGVTVTGVFDPALWEPIESQSIEFAWRLPNPIGTIPDLTESYKFAADRATDPISNAMDLEIPPVVSETGDWCIVGKFPSTWSAGNPGFSSLEGGNKIYVERAYQNVNVYRDGALILSLPVGGEVESQTPNYYVVDFAEVFETPGNYEIEALDSEGIPHPLRGRFRVPVYPEMQRDDSYKIITIAGATLQGGKVTCGDWDEISVRVIPHPVQSIDGVNGPLPWANYMYVPAEKVWDAQRGRIDVGEAYAYAVGLTLTDTDYGGVEYRFGGDYDEPPVASEGSPAEGTT